MELVKGLIRQPWQLIVSKLFNNSLNKKKHSGIANSK